MSNKDISKYLTKEDGTAFSNDTELLNLAADSKVTNKNSGLTYKKAGSNVFDKVPIEVETDAVLYTEQSLTSSQKQQARTNIGLGDMSKYVRSDVTQSFNQNEFLKAAFNVGMKHNGSEWHFRSINLGNFQLTWGSTNIARTDLACGRISEAVFYIPFTAWYSLVPSAKTSSPANCPAVGTINDVYGPRACAVGLGSNGSSANYIAIGPKMLYNYIGTVSGNVDLNDTSSFTFAIDKNLVDDSLSTIHIIVDMFISRNTADTNYIEYTGSATLGAKKISTKEIDDTPYDREYDLDLGRDMTDHDGIRFLGYDDIIENGELYKSATFKRFKMRSFSVSVSHDSFFNGSSTYNMTFDHLLTGAVGRIRIMYPAKYANHSASNTNNTGANTGVYENSDNTGTPSASTTPATAQTWGVTMFETSSFPYGAARKAVGQSVSEGTVVREYHITQWTSTGPSTYVPNETKCYYVWKANGYTLTSSDKVIINNLVTQSYMTGTSYPRITYDSGTI